MFAVCPLFIHKEGMKGNLKRYTLTPPNPSLNKREGNDIASILFL